MSMSQRADDSEIPAIDYQRRMMRNPPKPADPGAHLTWMRMMSRLLIDLEGMAPHFMTALAATHRSTEFLRDFCANGGYEQALVDRIPHAHAYLRYFMAADERSWLADLLRCELWANCRRGTVPAEHHTWLFAALRIERRDEQEYAIVSYDVLETLQMLIGYADTGMSRAGRLLWFLGIAPIYPVHTPARRPGVVLFFGTGEDAGMGFTAAE
jgi:hypothetical protein